MWRLRQAHSDVTSHKSQTHGRSSAIPAEQQPGPALLSVRHVRHEAAQARGESGLGAAGSERVARSEVAGQALKEAGAINRSLAALGDVVSALQRRAQHVPFRNSRLTQVSTVPWRAIRSPRLMQAETPALAYSAMQHACP